MINNMKIHMILEYIKQYDFEFETDEVIENLNEILSSFQIADVELEDEEYFFLIDELIPIAEQFEFREATHLAMQEPVLV